MFDSLEFDYGSGVIDHELVALLLRAQILLGRITQSVASHDLDEILAV